MPRFDVEAALALVEQHGVTVLPVPRPSWRRSPAAGRAAELEAILLGDPTSRTRRSSWPSTSRGTPAGKMLRRRLIEADREAAARG